MVRESQTPRVQVDVDTALPHSVKQWRDTDERGKPPKPAEENPNEIER
jgi:hypothetical protein